MRHLSLSTDLSALSALTALTALTLFASAPAWSQATAAATTTTAAPAKPAAVPQVHIPNAIAVEMSLLERSFETALRTDCATERCFPKGCVYVRHQTIDQPRNGSLPGLPVDEGIGSVPVQEYLTDARCEFTHERSVSNRDVQALVNRLELRLSRGFRKVTVVPQALDPINKSLAESTKPPEEDDKKAEEEKPEEPETPPAAEPPPPPAPPEPLTMDTAVRELWATMLPHLGWMLAIVLLTLAIAILIWAGRRLGAATLEEKMVLAQIAHQQPPAPEADDGDGNDDAANVDEDKTFAEQQEHAWRDRMANVEQDQSGPIAELLREWLKVGDFPMLARAVFIFGDGLAKSFSTESELALKKIEFADYFRDVDEDDLPSRSEFFKRLNQHAMSSVLMSQEDVQLYRSLREDFGSGGVLSLMEELPHRYAALLFALVPTGTQQDVARLMPMDLRFAVAEQLLASSRISKEESAYVFACIGAARDGGSLPPPPKGVVSDRGPSIDAASALSVLLPQLPVAERPGLFKRALHGSTSAPQWYEDIFFGEMLYNLADEERRDLLLDVDVRGLAAWLSQQGPNWQRSLTASLSPSMQAALRGNATFSSRAEQAALARKGQAEITKALKGHYAKGKTSFLNLVSSPVSSVSHDSQLAE